MFDTAICQVAATTEATLNEAKAEEKREQPLFGPVNNWTEGMVSTWRRNLLYADLLKEEMWEWIDGGALLLLTRKDLSKMVSQPNLVPRLAGDIQALVWDATRQAQPCFCWCSPLMLIQVDQYGDTRTVRTIAKPVLASAPAQPKRKPLPKNRGMCSPQKARPSPPKVNTRRQHGPVWYYMKHGHMPGTCVNTREAVQFFACQQAGWVRLG